jgi:hypothetical protein
MNCQLRANSLFAIGLVAAAGATAYPYGTRFESISRFALPPPMEPLLQIPQIPSATPIFAEWIAHGSGCRARSNTRGDVTMERVAEVAGQKNIHTVRFHLDQLQLSSARMPPNTPLDFAKECAIRVQVMPPAGKRIKSLFAKTSVVSVKSVGTKLTLAGTLKIGALVLGQRIVIHQATAQQAGEEPFELAPGSTPDQSFPSLNCSEPKLGGFDFTWIAERRATTDHVFVEVSDAKVLELAVELEDCK